MNDESSDALYWYRNPNIALTQGCTDPEACNYDPAAEANDGSCEYESCVLFGDSNGDGVVDVLDLLEVSNNFGCTEDCEMGDANGDGVVNVLDFIVIALLLGRHLVM